MQLIRDLNRLTDTQRGCVVALGNFDGMHLGHRAIMQECRTQAKRYGVKAAAMSFFPHPRMFFARKTNASLPTLEMYSLAQKLSLLAQMNMDHVFLLRFTNALASMDAGEFIQTLLCDTLQVRHVITGENFGFGKGRTGNAALLAEAAKTLGFGYSAMPAVTHQGGIVSSSATREALEKGDITKANALLGQAYHLCGIVRHGEQRGRQLGFATANLSLHHRFMPRRGVYAIRARWNGNWQNGVANIGVKPTFGTHAPRLEAHLFDCAVDLYGKKLEVECLSFLRPEQKFDSVDALRQQIEMDCINARKWLNV